MTPVRDAADVPYLDRIALEPLAARRWRSRYSEPNPNGRTYGGQLLALAVEAALREVPAERAPTMLQFLFRQGALPNHDIDLTVAPLQEGKRFSAVQVQGQQAGRAVLSAQLSFAVALDGLSLEQPSTAPGDEQPGTFPTYAETPAAVRDAVARLGTFGVGCEPAIERRIPDAAAQVLGPQAGARFRQWLRIPQPLPAQSRSHYAALAYLSDWWLTFCFWIPQLRDGRQRPIYTASLNHTLWFHRAPRADQWVHMATSRIHVGQGRGLAIGHFHDREGRHLATAMQECLTTYQDGSQTLQPPAP